VARPRPALSKREKEILDIVYARGHASAADVRDDMKNPPTYAGVRTILRVLVEKGHLRIVEDGPRYDYWPTVSAEAARRSEIQHLLRTFFGGSAESALATLLDVQGDRISDDERKRMKKLIDQAVREGR
jgi:predicted transcriptional regulator